MMKKVGLFIILSMLFTISAFGQISTEELPVGFTIKENIIQSDSKTLKSLPHIDRERIQQEDIERDANGAPPRFGYRHPVDFNLSNSGQWFSLSNGDKIWKLDIFCPDALSINLLYNKFWLPEGAKFFVYSNDKKYSIGAFTSANNKGDKENLQGFATGLIYGDRVTLEYYQPKNIEEDGIISIAYVVHGYRYINLPESTESVNASGTCQVNINCSEGQNWQNEKNAVALIIVGGNALCTGSLINTTAYDNRPLFLTANHCLQCDYDALGDSILNYWSFYWHYESPSCTPTTYPSPKSTTGAVVIANNGASDFALLRLTEDPKYKSGVTPYYLGWDRSGNFGTTEGVGIHHPQGDVKKIATYYYYTPVNSDCLNFTYCQSYLPNSNFWKIYWQSTAHGYSVTEGGSSGSPLLNYNRHVIGQLLGAGDCPNPNCSNPSLDVANYGKISASWYLDNNNPKRRLSNWLDPNNTGVYALDGLCSGDTNFTNQTIITDTTVTACCNIIIRNVTIQHISKLTVNVPGTVSIEGPFSIGQGSQLEVNN
jgi:hypothetical protein